MSQALKEIPPVKLKSGLINTFFTFIRNPFLFLNEYALNEEGISQFRIFNHRIVHISRPEHLKHIMQAAPEKYTQSRDRDHMQMLFGNGLLTSSGKYWKKQRTLIQPCFGKAKLESLFSKIVMQVNKFPMPENKPFNLHAFNLNLVNHIIADILFSNTDPKTLNLGTILVDLKAETLKRLRDFSLPLWVPTRRNFHFKTERKTVYAGIKKLIQERKTEKTELPDLLSFFLQAKDKTTALGMTDEELTEELLGVYAAAHEPVAIALSYIFYLLATNPEAEQKLRAELKTVLNKEELNFETLPKLVFTKQVVQEALRLYPPVWISGKRALQTDNLNGYKIRKNDNFIYSPMILHRHQSLWSDAKAFKPERFTDAAMIDPFAYIPFGGGAKFCIGSHLALMILQLAVAKIHLEFTLKTEVKEVAINPFTTLKPLTDLTFIARKMG